MTLSNYRHVRMCMYVSHMMGWFSFIIKENGCMNAGGGGRRIVVSIGFFSGFSEGGEKLHKVKVTYMFQSAFGLWL